MNQRNKLKQPELATMLDDALKLHQAGRLPKAKKIYQKILKKDSTHNDALHMLELLEQQNGNNDAAIRLYKKAMIDSQRTPELLTNYGNALTTIGKPEEAITAFEKAVEINPDLPLHTITSRMFYPASVEKTMLLSL